MSYVNDYLDAILANKDENAIDEGWFGTLINGLYANESYADAADYLEGKLDFEDVEFTSAVLADTFGSKGWSSNSRWEAPTMLFSIFNIDDYDESNVYSKADTLMKYAEHIGLPGDWEEKLEKATLLDNFEQNYSRINPSEDRDYLSTDKLIDIIQNQDYDVYNTKQVEILAELVYYMTDERNPSFAQEGKFDSTRQWNQLAINAEMDEDVLKAIESGASGWYVEDIEDQMDKVDMQDFQHQTKRDYAQHLANHRVTEEMVDKWNEEYKDILHFIYNVGFVGLEDQRNDSLVIEFDDKEIYRDEGRGNEFGNTSLDSSPVMDLLKNHDYKKTAEIFLF